MRGICHLLLAGVLVVTQTACVSTGPQRLSRDQAQQIRPGETITLILQDGFRLQTSYQGQDDTGILTGQGHFDHESIRYLEVERFSAGETVARTAGLYAVLAVVGGILVTRALLHSLEHRDE